MASQTSIQREAPYPVGDHQVSLISKKIRFRSFMVEAWFRVRSELVLAEVPPSLGLTSITQ